MTIEALKEAIKRLITKRANAPESEHAEINAKLNKLYNIKYLALEQANK